MKKLLLMVALLLWSGVQLAMAQSRPVKGQVLDDRGEGIPGASVQIKGSNAGTITDIDGNFSLEVPDDDEVLVISAIGYANQEINAGDGDNVLSVKLKTSSTALNETIVTANAVRREKRSLGYSTAQVSGNDLTAGGSVSPLNALAGKVAGMNVTTTSGAPGSSSRVVLRGGSSVLGNNQALIVVDGVPVNNAGLGTAGNIGNLSNQVDYGNRGNDINPDDIESISVLKGPAATALYGSSGANGALMITTKKGNRRMGGASKMDVEVNTGVAFSSILKYPDFQNSYGQGNIYEGAYPEDRRENFSWGYKFDNEQRPWGQVINGKTRVKPYSAIPDNISDFFNTGTTYNNSVAINGGTETSAFRLGFNALNSNSIFPGKDYNKYGVTFNGNVDLSNRFYASVNFDYSKINSDLPAFGQGNASILDNLYQMPRDIPIRELRNLNDPFNSMDYVDTNGVHRYGYYGAYALNPYYTLDSFKNTNKVDRLFGNVTVGFKITPWLKLEDRLATDVYSDRRYQKNPIFNSEPADETGLYTRPQSNPGRYSEDLINSYNIYNDLMLSINKQLNKDFYLTGYVGQNITQQSVTETYASTNEDGGLVVPGYYNLTNSNGPAFDVNSESTKRKVRVYTDLSLGYKNMLFLGVTGAKDWVSTVKNSITYGGINGSFVFSELFDDKTKNIWNYGKLRVSYARVGNDANPYLWTTTYGRTTLNGDFGSLIFPFNDVPGFSYGDVIGNPNIKPEYSTEFEIGTENSFFNDRVSFDFSYYNKNSGDQIIPVALAASSGFKNKTLNAGLITNHGVELAARFTPIRTRSGFKWEIFGTYAKNVNLVKELETNNLSIGNAINGATIVATVGKPYGTFYTDGYLRDDAGHVVVDATTGLPLIDKSGSKFFGSYMPKWQASWGTTLSYKGFTLYMLFDTKQGGQFFSRTRDILAFVGTSKETEDRDPQVWANSVYEGTDGAYHTNTDIKYNPYFFYTGQANRPGEYQLVDASYVKMREARLSYTLPRKWMDKTPFGSATVSVYGNNLFIWTPSSNQFTDPELSSNGAGNGQGFEFSAMPSQRNYGFNLKFTF
ncbi:SusC/RagA family TonB-linked outer membrane protein [Taibaiella lutea]|uniref:SusC/RagA family TonB-linked outer membrane protein n=1 Tax=Taibaiella lutea TaxID=2608001 RepID=A0A5M6CPP5_9BACT|nr:SusC/RagA family TonB-linked outer membrane protein [Taibaiella lutea]KAA5536923.1 SusC/RagA family TonB-linked outer membrane protein [Taibaiella lutea]